MSKSISKGIRIITLAPIMATILFTILYIFNPSYFSNSLHLILIIVFIALFPLMAYPLSYIIPKIRAKGRPGQRSLAIVFSVLGYIIGFVFASISNAPVTEKIFYLTYLISGILMFVFNFVFKIRSSGHACGVSGPIFCLSYFIHWIYLLGYSLLILVSLASFRLKSHDLSEIIMGALIPIAAFFIAKTIL